MRPNQERLDIKLRVIESRFANVFIKLEDTGLKNVVVFLLRPRHILCILDDFKPFESKINL